MMMVAHHSWELTVKLFLADPATVQKIKEATPGTIDTLFQEALSLNPSLQDVSGLISSY